MNHKHQRMGHLFIAFLAVIWIFLTGCGQKYSSLEEYSRHSPLPDDFTQTDLSGDGIHLTLELSVSGNTVIMKMYADKTIFSNDPAVNATVSEAMDRYFADEKLRSSMNDGIDRLALSSGIDASQITVRYEIYNPGADTPSYSYSYFKP